MATDYKDRDGFLEFDEPTRYPQPPSRLFSDDSAAVSGDTITRTVPNVARLRHKPKRLSVADLSDWPVYLGAIVGALVAFWLVHR